MNFKFTKFGSPDLNMMLKMLSRITSKLSLMLKTSLSDRFFFPSNSLSWNLSLDFDIFFSNLGRGRKSLCLEIVQTCLKVSE